jgi:hypothetical protein
MVSISKLLAKVASLRDRQSRSMPASGRASSRQNAILWLAMTCERVRALGSSCVNEPFAGLYRPGSALAKAPHRVAAPRGPSRRRSATAAR